MQSSKLAWTWRVKEEYLEEYVQMHLNPWPDVLEEHSKAGVSNYSIFQNGSRFYYCMECDNREAAFAYLAQSDVCNRWNAITSRMIEHSLDFSHSEPFEPLREVFFH